MTAECAGGRRPIALIVGPGDRFLSGISYYTAQLTAALADRGTVATLLLRELCPRAVYPGRARVGSTDGMLPLPKVSVFNGLDWFWGASALRAWRFWRRTRPSVVILQWWTGTVLHSYLALAWLAKHTGTPVVIEFHEVQDVGEARLPLVSRFTQAGMRLLLKRTEAVVVHSEFDRRELLAMYPELAGLPIEVILHGPYTHHVQHVDLGEKAESASVRPVRLLIFGVVRPHKGHADLAEALRLLKDSELDLHVSVVGEVWQGHRKALQELETILPGDRLRIVDRYIDDDEVPSFFAAADLVVLPYRRCSASGPLHIAMSWGLPVVTTAVGGLVEATAGYPGAVLVPPNDPTALAEGIRSALPLVGNRHTDPRSWNQSSERYVALLNRVDVGWGRATPNSAGRTGYTSTTGEFV